MTRRLLGLLGLGVRARNVVLGVTGTRAELHRGTLHCVVMAADASPRTREKVERLAVALKVPVVRGPEATVLGAGLGRPPVQAIGVSDRSLARGVLGLSEE
ncbi:MAG TPA: ribosomal L7Ae/L30e/S12e/Gadd45 family protein [Gemmatimonadales bacterium]|nr:ribosomal L7Ae/L30e/S12e/Gadd45 family protein [Gemmatimonadales bacterium]